MKLTIVHDFLNQYGGAERVVGYFTEIFPEAPVHTSMFFPQSTYDFFKDKDIRTSFMQKIPGINNNYKKFFFLYPKAFKSFDLDEYDTILTSSSSFSNFIKKPENSRIISYCYTPARFLWDSDNYLNRENIPNKIKSLLKPLINNLRKLDIEASRNVDSYIAISNHIKHRIKKIYARDSEVIYPPIEVKKYKYQDHKEDYYLIVSRLKGYKRVDIAVEAFNSLSKKLIIIGRGEDEISLKKLANSNIKFLGRVDDDVLIDHYSRAKALIFTGKEDFGLTPVEAQASGTPVIAYRGGGALETIKEGETGIFFDEFEPGNLVDGIRIFENQSFDSNNCRKNAEKFDYKYFKAQITRCIKK